MNNLQIFSNQEFGQVRVVTKDNEPWFVGKDICDCLELNNNRQAMLRLDEDEKTDVILNDGSQNRKYKVVNEYGLYSLVLSSRKPEAKKFKRWVTHEVLPQIRKTGAYNVPQTYPEALRAYADEIEKNMQLKKDNQEMLPKAEFYDAVAGSKDAIEIGKAAKVLNMGIGRNKLFRFLREQKILQHNNIPYQEYIDRGYFRTIEQKYSTTDGETRINIKTLVFQKGLDYIRKLLAQKKIA